MKNAQLFHLFFDMMSTLGEVTLCKIISIVYKKIYGEIFRKRIHYMNIGC